MAVTNVLAKFLERRARARGGSSLLVFDHIPKTAGTTFRRSYLIAALPRDERLILSGGEKNADELARFISLSAEQRRRVRIVAGHNADALREHVPDARFLTIVRDPVDRAVSSYLHARFHPGGEALWSDVRDVEMGLGQFVRKYMPPDAQSAQLLGEGRFDEAAMKRRLRERYALVGYTEAFDQFVFMLHVLEAFPLCLYNNRLVRTERHAYVAPAEDLAVVKEWNAQDTLLHTVVRDEFQQRVQRLPSGTRAIMGRYLEALARFRHATGGDPARWLRLDESARDKETPDAVEFVFGRRSITRRRS
jgi:hypothetical protein